MDINNIKGQQEFLAHLVGYISDKAKNGNKTIRIADFIEEIIVPKSETLKEELLIHETKLIDNLRELTGSRPEKK